MDSHLDLFPAEDKSLVRTVPRPPNVNRPRRRVRGVNGRERHGLTRQLSHTPKILWRRLAAIAVNFEAIGRGAYQQATNWARRTITSERARVLDAVTQCFPVMRQRNKTGSPNSVAAGSPPATVAGLSRAATLGVVAIAAFTSATVSVLMTWNRNAIVEGGVPRVAAASAALIPALDVVPAAQTPATVPQQNESQSIAVAAPDVTPALQTGIVAAGRPQKTSHVARPPAVASGSSTPLVVITEPPGARITVNGVGVGVAPLTIRSLLPGATRLRVTKDGYAGEERTITLDATRGTRTLRISLQPIQPVR